MTVAELKQHITTDEADQVLEWKLQALELLIRAYTNNNFQKRAFRALAVAVAPGTFYCNAPAMFAKGDTLQVTESEYMQDLLVTVASYANNEITVNETIYNDSGVVLTKVVYPVDVKIGVVNLMKWELSNREKVGISSESISRHSVTYFDMNGENSVIGYPKALTGFLKPYMKARFGRGV